MSECMLIFIPHLELSIGSRMVVTRLNSAFVKDKDKEKEVLYLISMSEFKSRPLRDTRQLCFTKGDN